MPHPTRTVITVIEVDEVQRRITHELVAADNLPVVSATLYDWRTDADGDPDVDLLLVYDGFEPGNGALPDLIDRFNAELPLAVNPRLVPALVGELEGLSTLGHPLTEIAHTGVHVAGTPLLELVPNPAPYDPTAVRTTAHDSSRAWAMGIRSMWDKHHDGDSLALVVQSAADVALMHHRMGRTASYFDEVPTARSIWRLARIVGEDTADRGNELIPELRSRRAADCSSSLNDVRDLMEIMLDIASDTTAPGCSIR